MKVWGITGGVGMGKSALTELIRSRGVPVVDTDLLAHQLVQPGQPALAEIQSAFGSHLVDATGQLCRSELAHIVFADASARQKLEAILHPRIRSSWQAQLDAWRTEGRPAAVVVIPLLYETNAAPDFDAIICVACTGDTQQQRLGQRGWTPEQIRQRQAAQWPVPEKMALADYVVWTEGALALLAAQLDRFFP
ncbi:MAG TPA: dephospho-CoA kinase [Dongiaceae bacterium]|nr:dephospho-CoA kinase [Dongiaceae bacterium]